MCSDHVDDAPGARGEQPASPPSGRLAHFSAVAIWYRCLKTAAVPVREAFA